METQSWVERVKKAVEYRKDALQFLARARGRFPETSPDHAGPVTRLWLLADQMDPLFCRLLDELNRELLGGTARVETTRGVSLRQPEGMPELDARLAELLPPAPSREAPTPVYECTWSLMWGDKAVSITLALPVADRGYEVQVSAQRSHLVERVAGRRSEEDVPRLTEEVQEALVHAFAAEANVDTLLEELQKYARQRRRPKGGALGPPTPEVVTSQQPSPVDQPPQRQPRGRKRTGPGETESLPSP
ncbi:MAG: hypothetical protein HY683_05025 [Chloroflexi bacterium]|nr:hypothetical protein [Chloroflexota bacterium]